jgi:capsule polysaccharide export protein KpsE/RkpR
MADKQVPGMRDVLVDNFVVDPSYIDPGERRASREETVARLRILWERRQFLSRMFLCGLAVWLVVALLIPSEYESVARLMPPDQQAGTGLAMLAGLAGEKSNSSSSIAGLASTLLGLKTSGDLFLGVLASRTVQDDLIQKFDLRKVYGVRRWETARAKLAGRTDLSSDRKSGIITIKVADRRPERAQAMAQEYVNELDRVITNQNTSAAHRERVFLEQRLQQVKQDLEVAEKNFSQFASKNAALDIPTQGKAMMEATANLQGELIAAQTQLEGLKQIYTDNNVRVRSTQARIAELERQLAMLNGQGASKTASGDSSQSGSLLYPSFRQLPLVGVSWADLLRNAKVQEAIFQVLTQEYELAKVEEAKEIPSVKVLDAPDVPESKSFPPRILIALVGGLAFLAAGICWILGLARWERLDSEDPAKCLAERVFLDVTSDLTRVSGNGGGKGVARTWQRLKRSRGNQDSPTNRSDEST